MTALATETRPPGVYANFDDTLDWTVFEDTIDWDVVPDTLGPTWNRDPHWKGPRDPEGYILPELTLGWQAVHWIEHNLLADETDEDDNPLPFQLTPEQVRFILWFYAIDESGRFLYRNTIMQRLKGAGKDPLAACIAALEFVGPCRLAGWATRDIPEKGLKKGDPVAKPHPRAWVQIAAVALSQTQNTMKLFAGLFSKECMATHGIDIGKEVIYAYEGQKMIQAVTSSPKALEGNRPTLVIKNETHHWLENNEGHGMAKVIRRNAAKAKGGAARSLSITNAYEPGEDSVARQEREAYELIKAGLAENVGIMYDSLEAPKAARLRPRFPDEEEGAEKRGVAPIPAEVKTRLLRRYLRRVLEAVRGDAWWLDIPGLIDEILDPQNKASESRRWWFNQITAAEDAWVRPEAVDASISKMAVESRAIAESSARAQLEAGWLVAPDEPIVMFFDGSKSDDSTALVGCRLSDGYCFVIGIWAKPGGSRGDGWLAPRGAVDQRVDEAFKRFKIVAFWGDPSHTKDETDDSSYWTGMLDKWMRVYKNYPDGTPRLDPKHWPVKSGLQKHAVNFDMTGAERLKAFIAAAEQTVDDFETLNDIEEFAPTFEIDGHPALVTHLKNAIQHFHPAGWGTTLMKDGRDSPRKIDLAVCLVGARMLRRVVLNLHEEEETVDPGEIWGNW
jgi:hypothetical protein